MFQAAGHAVMMITPRHEDAVASCFNFADTPGMVPDGDKPSAWIHHCAGMQGTVLNSLHASWCVQAIHL